MRYDASIESAYLAPVRCSKPVVAKIRGICMGGGLGLAAACDLRFCTADSRFRMPAGRLGLGYSVLGVRRFITVLGLQNTLDIFLSARIFGAAEALRMGFVSQVEETNSFDAWVDEWCRNVASNAPLTLRALKRTANELICDPGDRDLAAAEAAIAACFASDDYREGARAFMEKRTPAFRGA
jgi:enoyl-CoA hydratase/carnithine racemase